MSYKLLLADDSSTVQRVIQLTFADESIDVIAVGDGDQAIDSVKREMPDIVLADVSMPGKDGYEVASYLRSDPKLTNVPVVLLTGAFEPLDELRASEVGCSGVLMKPLEPKQVVRAVKELLGVRAQATRDPSLTEVSRASPISPSTDPILRKEPVDVSISDRKEGLETVSCPESEMNHHVAVLSESESQRWQTKGLLTKAFFRFLSVEQGSMSRVAVNEEMFKAVVDQVVGQMTDSVVRETTADIVSKVAERLVRDRIRRFSNDVT